ncbi:hypothetical protein L3Q82_007512 [Scortum barcoo]|uniref:Uncharacterized protein n=1 Tax=Scortum barcoo TaxID=214431 RepID=A0ACB8WN47_9TELE|nr:hypothetical protein L3Q82_007512 [Scortum barcoo]
MMAKLSSLLNNTSHPLQDTLTALGSSFSERLLHPRCVKERFTLILWSFFCTVRAVSGADGDTAEYLPSQNPITHNPDCMSPFLWTYSDNTPRNQPLLSPTSTSQL